MGADSPHRAFTYPPNPWLTLSLAVATLMTAWPPRSDGGFSFFLPLVLLAASLRFRVGPLALIGLFVIGVELRGLEFGAGLSDVPETIRLALGDMLRGGNPYAPVFDPAFPLQQPFPYGPLALLWYLPFRDPRLVELGVSVALLAVLAVRGRPLGLALWATVPVLVHLASDGSNDHTAALLVLVALVVLERSPRAGALLVGVAAGFKIYALAWLPPIFVWAGAGALATGILGFVLVWLPAAVVWGAGNILDTFRAADSIHTTPYFSLGQVLHSIRVNAPRDLLNAFRLLAGVVTAALVAPLARSHAAVVIGGMLIYAVTLYTGFWSTPAYLVPLAALLCWYIDVWFSPALAAHGESDPTRVRWPGDPIGRLTAAVNRRWPPVAADRIGHS